MINYEQQYFDLLRHLHIHDSHSHDTVLRYVKNFQEEVADARAYKHVVQEFLSRLANPGTVRADGL